MRRTETWLALLDVDRIAAMREFLVAWYPDLTPGPLPPELPAPLAELYAMAAGRPELLGTQNSLYPPDQLRPHPEEGLLIFGAENQGNFSWLIDPAEEDPMVWLAPLYEAPLAEREPLSGFLVQFCLFEALMSGVLAGSPVVPTEQARQVTDSLHEVPLAPWHWPADPTRFFVGPDLVLCASTYADHIEIMAGARTPAALAPLAATDVEWELFED